jgi:hypothetical protein
MQLGSNAVKGVPNIYTHSLYSKALQHEIGFVAQGQCVCVIRLYLDLDGFTYRIYSIWS